jgi:hypothetical protein
VELGYWKPELEPINITLDNHARLSAQTSKEPKEDFVISD